MANELDRVIEPATTENIKNRKRKTLLEFLPDSFKRVVDEHKPNTFDNIKPNSVALTAKILDDIIESISDDWSIPVEEILKEFKLEKSLEEAIALYSIRKSELLKGFFIFKGTKVDIAYILRVSGYDLDIYDYQRLTRTPKDKLKNFEFNEDEQQFYYIGLNGSKKRVNNCELFAIINADLSSPSFQGYNRKTLEAIKSIIASRLLVCVYINRLGINFHIRDHYDKPIQEITKKWKDLKYIEDYFSALNWDSYIHWDDKKKWDTKRVISDFMSWSKPYRYIDSVFEGPYWDKDANWDNKEKWDNSSVKLEDRIVIKRGANTRLKDLYTTINNGKDRIGARFTQTLHDFYNPVSLLWDNNEEWDRAVKRIYGNKWDLKSIYEVDRLRSKQSIKPLKDEVDITDYSESVWVVRYNKKNKQVEHRSLTNE